LPVIIGNMASDPLTLGTRIRRARERARLSQEELAKAVSASPRAVGDWENDRRKPRNRLGALEDVLGVRLDSAPEPEPAVPKSLERAIMQEDGLTPDERQAVLDAVRETLATERGPSGPSGPGSG
jgi:transcriptional regulator with XRE-family HTH domain